MRAWSPCWGWSCLSRPWPMTKAGGGSFLFEKRLAVPLRWLAVARRGLLRLSLAWRGLALLVAFIASRTRCSQLAHQCSEAVYYTNYGLHTCRCYCFKNYAFTEPLTTSALAYNCLSCTQNRHHCNDARMSPRPRLQPRRRSKTQRSVTPLTSVVIAPC